MSVGAMDNLGSNRMEYPVTASHNTVKVELAERVEFDQTSVLDRLKIAEVDSLFVNDCKKSLLLNCAKSVKRLKGLSATADNIPVADLALEPVLDVDETAARGTAREKEMYKPLTDLFDYIRDYSQPGTQGAAVRFDRCFINQTRDLIPDQTHTPGFPRFTPDFTLFHDRETLRELSKGDKRRRHWRYQDAFIEVKAASKQHPFPNENKDATPLLTQVANYARLHLSAWPFSVFSVGLMIYGRKFCVGMFDRFGGQLSPEYDLWDNLDVLIRIVYNMTRVLTDEELGRDPSVVLSWQNGNIVFGAVEPVGDDERRWAVDIEKPLWSSLSLFGRGTTIWHVRARNSLSGKPTGPVFVMKSSWRSSKRSSESDIYQLIASFKGDPHPGLAKYVAGADVKFPVETRSGNHSGSPITIHQLRRAFLPPEEETMFLHRIILKSNGKAIWEYEDDEELLRGMLGALAGHKFLVDKGILHRDVSAGNILLSVDRNKQKSWGFLTDVEYARISDRYGVGDRTEEVVEAPSGYGPIHPTLSEPMIRVKTTYTPQFMRGAAISGTYQFMSRRLLSYLRMGETSVQTMEEDDVESFFWVLVYAVFRQFTVRAVGNTLWEREARSFFIKMFGATNIQEIFTLRQDPATLGTLITSNIAVIDHTTLALRSVLQEYKIKLQADIPLVQGVAADNRKKGKDRGKLKTTAELTPLPMSRVFTHANLEKSMQTAVNEIVKAMMLID